MEGQRGELFNDLRRFIENAGVRVILKDMDIEKPGAFDGLTIAINPKHDRTAASNYLAHSFGSIVQWSTDHERSQTIYDDLREAKETRQTDAARFEAALAHYRVFEQASSEHAVWMLSQIGHEDAIAGYTMFFRADIEAMTIFHRTGKEPPWPEFYSAWKRKVACGEVRIVPFVPKPIPRFRPVRIEHQEVIQERD